MTFLSVRGDKASVTDVAAHMHLSSTTSQGRGTLMAHQTRPHHSVFITINSIASVRGKFIGVHQLPTRYKSTLLPIKISRGFNAGRGKSKTNYQSVSRRD